MRVLLIALLAAISYAQTEKEKTKDEEEPVKMWYDDYDITEEDIVELPGSCNGVRSLLYKPQSEWGPEDEPYQLTILESFRTLGRCEFASTYVGEPEGTITGWLEIRELPDCKAMIEYAPDCVEAFMSEENGGGFMWIFKDCHPYMELGPFSYLSLLTNDDIGAWSDNKYQYDYDGIPEAECIDFPTNDDAGKHRMCAIANTRFGDVSGTAGGYESTIIEVSRNFDVHYRSDHVMGFIRDPWGNTWNALANNVYTSPYTVEEFNKKLVERWGEGFEYFEWQAEKDVFMPSVDVAEGPGGARYMGILLEVEHFVNTEEHSMWQLVEYCGDGPEGSYLDPNVDIADLGKDYFDGEKEKAKDTKSSDSKAAQKTILIIFLVIALNIVAALTFYYCRKNVTLSRGLKKYEISEESEI